MLLEKVSGFIKGTCFHIIVGFIMKQIFHNGKNQYIHLHVPLKSMNTYLIITMKCQESYF